MSSGQSEARVIAITKNKKTNFYLWAEISCEIGGRGFAMQKIADGAVHHLRIDPSGYVECDCRGFCRWDYCKHVRALNEAIANEEVATQAL